MDSPLTGKPQPCALFKSKAGTRASASTGTTALQYDADVGHLVSRAAPGRVDGLDARAAWTFVIGALIGLIPALAVLACSCAVRKTESHPD